MFPAPNPLPPSLFPLNGIEREGGGGGLPVIMLRPDYTAVIEAIDCGDLIY